MREAAVSVKSQIVELTAELAQKWLSKNTHNRKLRNSDVERYARDMIAGLWRRTHQGIAFDWNGIMIDGQHRCAALTLAQKTLGDTKILSITTEVTTGLDPAAQIVFDSGIARVVGDQLRLMYDVDNGGRLAACARVIEYIETRMTVASRASVDAVWECVKKHRAGLDWAIQTLTKKPGNIAPVVGSCAFAYAADPDGMNKFAILLRDGAGDGWEKGNPAYTLREWLLAQPASTGRDRNIIALVTLRFAYSALKGQVLTYVKPEQMTSGGTINDVISFFGRAHQQNGELV